MNPTDYFSKSLEAVSSTITAQITAAQQLAAIINENASLAKFITADPETLAVKRTVTLLAPLRTQADVILITGQSGSGKELIAQALHDPRCGPFVAVNLAALPDTLYQSLLFGHTRGSFTGALDDRKGAFESAEKGTIFLDEIGDMPLHQQAALLRVLETKAINKLGNYNMPTPLECRIVAATNKDLDTEVEAGRFRADLYARLFNYHLKIPPFSKRIQDIILIGQHYGLVEDAAYTLTNSPHIDNIHLYGARYIKAAAERYKIFGHIGHTV